MDGHVDETDHSISLCRFENKRYKEQRLQEIITAICAELNSNGGKVVINIGTDSNDIPVEGSRFSQISMVIRIMEQYMISITGLSQYVSKTNCKEDGESIIILVKQAGSLITTNYNLYLPSQSQVVQVSPLEPLEKVKDDIINRKVVQEPVELGSHCKIFLKGENCDFHETRCIQIKHLKADQSNHTTLADRMTGKSNRFSCYVSAFANYNGGHIYYGIRDDGVIEGELIPNEAADKREITKKVEKTINKMIWPEKIDQPKQGEHWEIFFEPVVDENSKPIPSTFVIVIYIAPCLGGVFTEIPECYEMVEGKVTKMSFATWRKRILQPVWLHSREEIPRKPKDALDTQLGIDERQALKAIRDATRQSGSTQDRSNRRERVDRMERGERQDQTEQRNTKQDERTDRLEPSKNQTRTEPRKMGVEHLDMSNIDIDDIIEQAIPGEVESAGSNTQKEESKMSTQNVKTTESSVSDKNSENDKRQPTGNNWKSVRPPRFEKSVPGKRNTDGRRLKADTKDNGEPKSQPDMDKHKEKNDGRPRSTSRPRDVNKTQKAKPQVKNAKSQNSDESDPNIGRNSQDKTENEEQQQNMNKRDSVELDVQSMSESLLDETPLGVHIVETSKAGSGNASMVKIQTEDDLKMDFEMQEKMEAAKKAWDHSVSSASIQTSQWKASVTKDENTESTEVSVVDQIPIPSPEPEESSEPLVTTPRLKKPIAGEQQNVRKVKLQQQQHPVKPQPVPSEVPEEYPTATARPVLKSPAQASHTVQPHQATIFTSKPATQGYTYSFEQQALVPISHQYVQTDMSSIQRHRTPVRPQTLHAASQSPPQRAATYPQGQSVSTPSPLSHQPLMQDRPLMQPTALYSTNTYAGNQYFPISVVRPAAPPQFPATINEDISNSMYTVQVPKSQNPNHGYETAVPTAQQVFLPVEQQYVQTQRQHPVGFYSDNTNQANLGGMPAHVPKSVAFPPSDKQVRPQRDSRTPSGRQEQQYTPPGQSEMSKHVHAKPFQPPTSSPSGSATHQIAPNVRQVPTVSGQSNARPAYHVNNAVLSMQATGVTALQGISSSDHTGTSPIGIPAHALPVSHLSFHQFPAAVGSFPRQIQVPVQQLTPPTYPAGLIYRTTFPSYPTTTSVANQPGVLVHKPAPTMRQLVRVGRGPTVPHRMPEPIQRPRKAGFHLGTLKEKQLNPQPRLKTVHPMPSRSAFNPVGAAQPQMAAYQFQPLPRPQQPTQPQQQQQQMFRNQQHQQMLSNAQQFALYFPHSYASSSPDYF